MNMGFIIENAMKTSIATLVLLVCWAVVSPTYAMARDQDRDDRRTRMVERMTEMRGNVDKNLSVEQVRDIVEGRLAMMGNANLKVGGATEGNKDTVAVDIVTQDDSLVQTMEISARTGRPSGAERHFNRMNRGKFGKRGNHMGRRGGGNFNTLAMALGLRNRDLELTVDQARTLAESRLILSGNDRLKIGSVEVIDDETIAVEIVTVDDSLVVRREIDRDTGRMKRGNTNSEE
jgi:hypothetical protein